MVFSSGDIIDSRYQVVALLGEGGMGAVYSALHLRMQKMVALKVLKANALSDRETVARFRNEARLLSGLEHPNILEVHAIGVCTNGQPYIAMDLLTGRSVSDLIRVHGPFENAEAIEIVLQLCDALQYAHEQKVVHRDIKPTNIVIEYDQAATPRPRAKLVDFGIAKMLGDSQNLTQTGHSIGSLAYLDSQRLEGKPATVQSDIYALGCTLYEMLTGHHPYPADNIMDLFKLQSEAKRAPIKNSEALNAVLNRMLSQRSEEQYPSVDAVRRDLIAVKENNPLAQTVPTTKHPRREFSFRGKYKVVVTAFAVVSVSFIVAAACAYNASSTQGTAGFTTPRISAHDVEAKMLAAHRAKALKQWDNAVSLADEAISAAEAHGDPLVIAEANNLAGLIEGYRQIHGVPKSEYGFNLDGPVFRRQIEIACSAVKYADAAIESSTDPMRLKRAHAAKFMALISVAHGELRRGMKISKTDIDELTSAYRLAVGAITKQKEQEYLDVINSVRSTEDGKSLLSQEHN